MVTQALRVNPFRGRGIALPAIVVLWLLLVAKLLMHVIARPDRNGIAVCAAIVLAPVIALKLRRMPIYMLALYAALVPMSSLLVTGSGATVERYIAIPTGGLLILATLLSENRIKPSPAFTLLIALTAYAGATVFWALDQPAALTAYGTLLSYVLLYFAITLYPVTAADLKLIWAATIAGSAASAAYGGFLFWHGQQVVGSRLYIGNQSDVALDPNEFSTTLLLPIAVTVMLFLSDRSLTRRTLWLVLAVVLFVGFVVSGSRGTTIALAVMVAFLAWKSRYRFELAVAGGVCAIAIFSSPIGLRFMQSDVATGDQRFDLWRIGLASLQQYWVAGAGIGNFKDAFAQYFLLTPHRPLAWDRPAHSVLLQSAVELGSIGLLLVLAFWYRQFVELRSVRSTQIVENVCLALRASVLGLFISGLSLDLFTAKYTWMTFSLVAMMRTVFLKRSSQ